MALDLELRHQIARYVAGELGLGEFKEWFVPFERRVRREGGPGAQDLAGEVELFLAEVSNDHWTEPELRKQLTPLVESYRVKFESPEITTSASAGFVRVGFPSESAGTRLVKVSG